LTFCKLAFAIAVAMLVPVCALDTSTGFGGAGAFCLPIIHLPCYT
jgi:hypothetical protein